MDLDYRVAVCWTGRSNRLSVENGSSIYPDLEKTSSKVKPEQINENQQISLLVANVLTPNDKYHLLLEHIDTLKPDVVLTLESDSSWQNALVHIEQDYPYRVPVPLDNLYGMHLYSRLPLHDTEVKFILSDEIPSIHASVTLRSGIQVQLYCLHLNHQAQLKLKIQL
jgi:endonuclease/exonuclease/phosphatase (EEP) superfamily protein YafD